MDKPNTLGLDDDMDSVELLQEVERIFDIQISNEQAATVVTMNDLYQIVLLGLDGNGGINCRTSMAFYRIRHALRATIGDTEIRPSTPLRSIWIGSPRSFRKIVEHYSGLRLTPFSITGLSVFASMLLSAAIIYGLAGLLIEGFGWQSLAMTAALLSLGLLLFRLDPLEFGSNSTVGDIARGVAAENFGLLVRRGARNDKQEVWGRLVTAAARYSEKLQADQVSASTIMLQSQFDRANRA